MVLKCQHIALVFIIFITSCRQNDLKPPPSLSDSEKIQTTLIKVKSYSAIDTFITSGLYDLAFESVITNKGKLTNNQTLTLANRFIENGEFDKGICIANMIKDPVYKQSVLVLNLYSTLNKMDNSQAQILLDSLLALNNLNPGIIAPVEIILAKGYLAHNRKDYINAVELNQNAIDIIIKKHLSVDLLAKAYHRIGNDYNDIVRDTIPFPENKKICLKKAIDYYHKEYDLLIRNKTQNETRIALNFITTAMVLRTRIPNDSLIGYYNKALSSLIIANRNEFILTRNPIYTSIALTQLGGIYFDAKQQSKMDSVFDINSKLIQVRSLYKVDDKQSLDVFEYFPQRSQEVKILFQLANSTDKKIAAQRVLELTSSCKYPNLNLIEHLQEVFGEHFDLAIKNWILLNELDLYYSTSRNRVDKFNVSVRLKEYNEKIRKLTLNQQRNISDRNVNQLLNYCKAHNLTIFDYQVLYGGSISVIEIEPDCISLNWIRANTSSIKLKVASLLQAAKNNQVDQYCKIAYSLSEVLGLNKIHTKGIIICPDEYLEKLPFDALVGEPYGSNTWSSCNFIGLTHEIRLIPNMSFLLKQSNHNPKLNIDVWSSDSDNESLPYNQQLIDQLAEKFETKVNQDNPENILHILAHTYKDKDERIEFRLNQDTITAYPNGLLNPKLAVLEGCGTGEGQNLKLEGSINLTRSFLYNGSESVIYSIWDADNQASTNLFIQFYRSLSSGHNCSEALFKAKISLIKDVYHPEWANPYYWANFQLTGQDLMFTN